jgi:hypothetical protein
MASHGIVVDHLETGVRYAISEANFDEKINRKVRDLHQHESVQGYQPKPRQAQETQDPAAETGTDQAPADELSDEPAVALADPTPEELAQHSASPDEDDASADVPTTE